MTQVETLGELAVHKCDLAVHDHARHATVHLRTSKRTHLSLKTSWDGERDVGHNLNLCLVVWLKGEKLDGVGGQLGLRKSKCK